MKLMTIGLSSCTLLTSKIFANLVLICSVLHCKLVKIARWGAQRFSCKINQSHAEMVSGIWHILVRVMFFCIVWCLFISVIRKKLILQISQPVPWEVTSILQYTFSNITFSSVKQTIISSYLLCEAPKAQCNVCFPLSLYHNFSSLSSFSFSVPQTLSLSLTHTYLHTIHIYEYIHTLDDAHNSDRHSSSLFALLMNYRTIKIHFVCGPTSTVVQSSLKLRSRNLVYK